MFLVSSLVSNEIDETIRAFTFTYIFKARYLKGIVESTMKIIPMSIYRKTRSIANTSVSLTDASLIFYLN